MNKALKYSLIGLAIASVGYGLYYLLKPKSEEESYAQRKKRRRIKIFRRNN